MKFLIWFVCLFLHAFVTMLIKDSGIILGGIPTAILIFLTILLARFLCKKWDEHKNNKQIKTFSVTDENIDNIKSCRKCNEPLVNNSKFCRKCGAEVLEPKNPDISDNQKFKVVIFDADNRRIHTEIREINTKNFPPEKFSDNNTYYAIETIKEGKKVKINRKKKNWEKKTNTKIQKRIPIKKNQKQKKSKLYIINIFVLLIPIVFSMIALVLGSWLDELFATIICCGIIATVCKTLSVTTFEDSVILSVFAMLSLIVLLLPCLIEDFWDEELFFATIVLVTGLYVFVCDLTEIVKRILKKYHNTQNYKMKCYKKINTLNDYREKGIITETEYEEARKQIVSKITK
ncbi:MAG: zinc ribbon domain-containing protein [Ruminococcaceae bacterium]|nr:zinc ribbon domain-containing protein [Oscillospiraceae bacterium]